MTDWLNPATEADIQMAIDQGLLRESHVFDVKKQPPPPLKNTDIAVDLASLAVDGGRILYGIKQPVGTGPTTRTPFVVGDLPERLEQIARGGATDPPLRLSCHYIDSKDHPDKGYLLVIIPISPEAPHQVEGKYRGRGDKTNLILPDAAVRRLHAERAQRETDVTVLLGKEIARDPTGQDLRTQGHLYIVAQPVVTDNDRLRRTMVTSEDWRAWLQGPFRQSLLTVTPSEIAAPQLSTATTVSGRQTGYALHTYAMGEDRHLRWNGEHPPQEDDLLDIEAQDDGGLRVFCARASYPRNQSQERSIHVILHELIVPLTRQVVPGALAVSAATDYLGSWALGIAIQGIGVASATNERTGGFALRNVDDYQRVTVASREELAAEPAVVVRRLLGNFYRSVGFGDFIPYLDANVPA